MSGAKIEIQIGEVRFSGEGEQGWLTQQLDKVLNKTEALIKLASTNVQAGKPKSHEAADFSDSSDIANKSLASFLKSKNATTSQVNKFLATAIWGRSQRK